MRRSLPQRAVAALRPRLVVMASLLLIGVLSGCVNPGKALPGLGEYEKPLRIYVGASSSTGGPFLSYTPDASVVQAYSPPGFGLDSGATTTAGSLQGQAPRTTEFVANARLPQDYYLNLSKPVIGVLYWSSALTKTVSASPYELENARLRAELWRGAERVGGDEAIYSTEIHGTGGEWQKLVMVFRPELAVLREGDTLSLKVYRFGGTADLTIGVGGTVQSFLEVRYFDFDPLAGGVYLEKGRLVTAAGGTPDTDGTSELLGIVDEIGREGGVERLPPGLHMRSRDGADGDPDDAGRAYAAGLLLSVPLIGLIARRPPGRRVRTLLIVGLLGASGGLAGCIGGGGEEAGLDPSPSIGGPAPTVTEQLIEDPALKEAGVGAVSGTVKDAEIGIPVAGAHASLLGTSLFTTTDPKGGFAFDEVQAGAYTLRVDADGFVPLERAVSVTVGVRLILEVPLAKPLDVRNKAHVHDYWPDGGVKVLIEDAQILPASSQASIDQALGGTTYYCVSNAYECVAPIHLDSQVVVPPGTGMVEVILDWDGSKERAPKEIGLTVQTATNKTASQYVARGPKDAFHVAIFPNEADPGHNQFSHWVFQFSLRPKYSLYHPTDAPPVYTGDKVKVRMLAYKGVVPFEPAHRDFWGTAAERPVVRDSTARSFTCTSCDLPREDSSNAYSWVPNKDYFVPPGTLEIRGKVNWTNYQNLPVGYQNWALQYHAADVPPSRWSEGLQKATITERGTNYLLFKIGVTDTEADQFYQSSSNWEFYLDDGLDSMAPGYSLSLQGYGTKLYFEATAIKDASYEF